METICSIETETENNNRCNHWNTEERNYDVILRI